MGGNKGRKLEYLIADALASGAEVVTTCGATDSNFIRQLAVACAVANLECEVVTTDLPYETGFPSPKAKHGIAVNEALCELTPIARHRLDSATWDQLDEEWKRLNDRLSADGKKVYEIPLGGSTPLGAFAFFEAAKELPECDVVVTAASSGSTLAGLTLAFHGQKTHVIGISCDLEPVLRDDILSLTNELAGLLELPKLNGSDLELLFDFVGEAYGIPSEAGESATKWLSQVEGIYLDPIYTAKAFAGLLSLAQTGEFKGKKVVFWHTGGVPSLIGHLLDSTLSQRLGSSL